MAVPRCRVSWLVDALGDADADVRLQAALELGEGRHGTAAGPLVARFGRERDFQVREVLTWAVLRMPAASLPLVRQALRSDRWLARLQATHTISKVGQREDGARLVPLVSDPIDAVASRAYWAAAQCGDPVVLPALLGQLSRGSSEHRNSLTVALRAFGDAAVPGLIGALHHGATPAVRAHAADTLAYLGSPDAEPAAEALLTRLTDDDEHVRLAALNALGQLELPAAWDAIDETVRSRDGRLQLLAARLTERRPSDRARRAAAARARTRGEVAGAHDLADTPPPAMGGPWPAPDLALVTCEGGPLAQRLAPMLARQVEVCRPRYLARGDVPGAVLDEVRASARQAARRNGRSSGVADRMAAGAVEQYLHDHVFLEQVSVEDPGRTVRDLLFGTEVRITDFARLDDPRSVR
jgi:HEAT repeat protein